MGNAAETKHTQVKKGDVVIEARNIVKRYGHLEALRGANIKVRAGEVMALIGDNGAGKSTLANIICGAIPRTSGELICKGQPVDIQSISCLLYTSNADTSRCPSSDVDLIDVAPWSCITSACILILFSMVLAA